MMTMEIGFEPVLTTNFDRRLTSVEPNWKASSWSETATSIPLGYASGSAAEAVDADTFRQSIAELLQSWVARDDELSELSELSQRHFWKFFDRVKTSVNYSNVEFSRFFLAHEIGHWLLSRKTGKSTCFDNRRPLLVIDSQNKRWRSKTITGNYPVEPSAPFLKKRFPTSLISKM